jgi:hypothetical protein
LPSFRRLSYTLTPLLALSACSDETAVGSSSGNASSEESIGTESSDTGDETMEASSDGESGSESSGDADVALPSRILAFHYAEACPSAWTKHVPAEGRLLVATTQSSEVGVSVGNPLLTVDIPGHLHDYAFNATIPNHSGITGLSSCCNETPAAAGQVELSGGTDATSIDLPLIAYPACLYDTLEDPLDGDPFPAGAVLFFERTSCPPGWEAYSAAAGRAIAPLSGGSTPGNTVGEALASGQSIVHGHTLSGDISVATASIAASSGGNTDSGAQGSAPFTGDAQDSDSELPYLQALSCRKIDDAATPSSSEDEIPAGTLAYFEALVCPAGWAAAVQSEGRFMLGLMDAALAGDENSSTSLTPGENRTHSHDFSGTVNLPFNEVALASGCCMDIGGSGDTSYAGTSSSSASGLPFIELLACAKD